MKKSLLEDKIQSNNLRIALVGFGYIGTCIGAVIANRGYKVVGIDVRKNVVDEINAGTTSIAEPGLKELIGKVVKNGNLTATTDFSPIADCDVVVVTVGTPLGQNFDPDTRDIIAAMDSIRPHLKPEHLIILKSTVPPYTTEKVVKPELDKQGVAYYLSFCPERLAEGRAIAEFESIPVVVGGIDERSTDLSAKFWRKVLGIETITVDSARAAELVKLADNLWIDLNVALANEMAMISDRIAVDSLQVIAAANSLPKGQHHVNILHPSVGVGGYCLTKDPWFVHHMGKQLGLDLKTPPTSRNVNDGMPEYSFGLMDSALKKRKKTWKQSKVAVLGLSFKNNTGDCRYSPTKPVIEKLSASGCSLELYDSWVNDHEAKLVTNQKVNRDLLKTLKGADVVVFLTGHDEFKKLTVPQLTELIKSDAVIFDGRNMMNKQMIRDLQTAGFIYQGVGR